MDHLLPGSTAAAGEGGAGDVQEQQRVEQLAKFQVSLSGLPLPNQHLCNLPCASSHTGWDSHACDGLPSVAAGPVIVMSKTGIL